MNIILSRLSFPISGTDLKDKKVVPKWYMGPKGDNKRVYQKKCSSSTAAATDCHDNDDVPEGRRCRGMATEEWDCKGGGGIEGYSIPPAPKYWRFERI